MDYAHLTKNASLVVLLGDTRLLTENSYMLKNLDLLASLIEKKIIKSVAHLARTDRLIERISFDAR